MKKILLIILVLSMILTTACWDMVELEDRMLPYSLTVDIADDDSEKSLFFCFSYPNINALGKSPTQEEVVYIIDVAANSIFEATHEIKTRNSKPIFLKHLNVIVMSESVFTNEKYFREVFDGIQRDFVINKMINLLITKEDARELLETKLKAQRQETIEGLLISMLRNEQESVKFTPIKVMEFIEAMDHNRAAVIPLGIPNDEIEIAGGGLFKDYQFVGYIDKDDNRNITLLNDKAVTIELDMVYNEGILSLLLSGFKVKKRLVRDEDILKIQYKIDANSQMQQYISHKVKGVESSEIMEDMEKAVNEYIESEISGTLDRLQKDYNADAIGILEYLYKFHPKIYNEVEEDWDSIFPTIDIDVEVDVKIRRRGLIS
ncbi:MAG TPA: Ger(x)C family spore germination protein [Tissierellaceae bacterium]|nr:Ger(x)C family spore germination protein [Tissierellaceae bacterium]